MVMEGGSAGLRRSRLLRTFSLTVRDVGGSIYK